MPRRTQGTVKTGARTDPTETEPSAKNREPAEEPKKGEVLWFGPLLPPLLDGWRARRSPSQLFRLSLAVPSTKCACHTAVLPHCHLGLLETFLVH